MTVTLDNRQQLAAPRRLRSVRPLLVGPLADELLLDESEQPALPPSYVTNARALVDRYPSSATALARLAQAEQACGNSEEALAAARTALARATEQRDASARLAAVTVLIAAGNEREVEHELEGEDLEGPLALLYATLAAERRAFDEALARAEGQDTAGAWALRGWVHLKRRRFQEAIHSYRTAIRKGGPAPGLLANIGLAHAALGERERAIKETRQALRLGPSQLNRVGFNLASCHLAGGEYDEALAAIRGLQEANPRDIEPLFAEAQVHLLRGEPSRAQRPLRRARTQLWAYLDDVDRAELVANLVFLDWHLDRIEARAAATKVLRELERIGFRSLRLASMLPVLLASFSDATVFKRAMARIRQAHPKAQLYELELHRAVLERRFEDATQVASAWANDAIFDPDPAIAATYLLCDVTGEFERAAELGRLALRRMPGSELLRNNLTYALALSGNLDAARKYMPPADRPHPIATHALVTLREGNPVAAASEYESAYQAAVKSTDRGLPGLVALHAHMAFCDFAPQAERPPSVRTGTALSDNWEDDPRYAIALKMLERRGIEPPAWFPRGTRFASVRS